MMFDITALNAEIKEETISSVASRLGIPASVMLAVAKGMIPPQHVCAVLAAEFPVNRNVQAIAQKIDTEQLVQAQKEKEANKNRRRVYATKLSRNIGKKINEGGQRHMAAIKKKNDDAVASQLEYREDMAKHRQSILADSDILSTTDFRRVIEYVTDVSTEYADVRSFWDGMLVPGTPGKRIQSLFNRIEDYVLAGGKGRPDWMPAPRYYSPSNAAQREADKAAKNKPKVPRKPHPWKLTTKERAADIRKRKKERNLGLADPPKPRKPRKPKSEG
jgi:hypothetical protein